MLRSTLIMKPLRWNCPGPLVWACTYACMACNIHPYPVTLIFASWQCGLSFISYLPVCEFWISYLLILYIQGLWNIYTVWSTFAGYSCSFLCSMQCFRWTLCELFIRFGANVLTVMAEYTSREDVRKRERTLRFPRCSHFRVSMITILSVQAVDKKIAFSHVLDMSDVSGVKNGPWCIGTQYFVGHIKIQRLMDGTVLNSHKHLKT